MRNLNIILITLTYLTRLQSAHADDDEDGCEFIKSLPAKSELKNLDFSTKDKIYPRDYCAQWRITSKYEVITVHVQAISQADSGACKHAYLKLADKKTNVIVKVNSQYLMRGPHVSVFFRPKRCLQDFRLVYRSLPDHEWADAESSENNDNDEDYNKDKTSGSLGRVIGMVVGCVIAVLLVVLITVLVIICLRRRRARHATSGDTVSVHFWSKPSGYAQGAAVSASTSREDAHESDSASYPASHKLGPADARAYSNTSYSTAAGPVPPPPYSGHFTSPTESSPFSKEPPPSYSDAVQSK
ncbi:hypothetical protein BsWGS_24114 [Bradybaena similaris]